MTPNFQLPPYPYETLDEIRSLADRHDRGRVDLSIGTPCDPVPDVVIEALTDFESARTYPPSIGSQFFLEAVSGWLSRQLGVQLPLSSIGACIGSKELVAGLPHILRLRSPDRDIVLYPAISYPSYAMGALLAGCQAVAVPINKRGELDLSTIDEAVASRSLCVWLNSPSNPTGVVSDVSKAVDWGRSRGITVISDECYIEFVWSGKVRSILQDGTDGILAVHSLSKRSNLAGLRAGFYTGDAELVHYLREIRKHQGFMVPGPVQVAGTAAFNDQKHVEIQRERYQGRLAALVSILSVLGISASMPDGAFYLWVPADDGDEWALVHKLATQLGMVVAPGSFFGDQGIGYVRIAAVATDDQIDLLRERAGN